MQMSEIFPPSTALPRRAPRFPLPPYRFVPKLHPHPLKNPAGHLFGKEDQWDSHSHTARWDIGVDLFNNHYFWEAHEVWEGLWKERSGAEKDFLQAMILLSASLLQEHLGRKKISRKSVLRAKDLILDPEHWAEKYQLDISGLLNDFRIRGFGDAFPKIVVNSSR